MNITEILKQERIRRAWSVGELAERAGVSRAGLYKIEDGATPRMKTLRKLALALDLDVAKLAAATQEAA